MDKQRMTTERKCKICGEVFSINRWQNRKVYCNGCYITSRKENSRRWARVKFNIPKRNYRIKS